MSLETLPIKEATDPCLGDGLSYNICQNKMGKQTAVKL